MRNHKKLYRSISASLLMLFAGLVLAPTVVTAGFLAATKKPVAPTQQTQQVALEPTAPKAAQRKLEHSSHFVEPASQANDEQPVPQAEPEPTGHGQHDNTGPTTFAIADFEPIHAGGAVFPRGGVGVDVAVASTGGNISKVTRKPNPPTTGDDQSSNEQSDDNQTDTTGAPGNSKPADSTPPAAGGDQHPDDEPTDTQLADNHGTPTDHNDDRPHVSVPEPSSLGLLAVGIIGLLLARRLTANPIG